MAVKDIIISWVSVIASLGLVIILVAFGWYVVWRLFLSRFKFIRELLGNQQEVCPSVEELRQARLRSSRKARRD